MKTEAIILAQSYRQARYFAERHLGLRDTRTASPSFAAITCEQDFNRVRGVASDIPVYVAPGGSDNPELDAMAIDYMRQNGNPIHRILDRHGNGVELDDRNPEHRAWAIKALMLLKAKPTHPLRLGLETFLEYARVTQESVTE